MTSPHHFRQPSRASTQPRSCRSRTPYTIPGAATGSAGRSACAGVGVILIAMGLMPKIGALAEAIPQFVLGGASLVMFGMVAAAGVRLLADIDYKANRFQLYVVALSVGFGLIPLVAPQFFKVVLTQTPALAPLVNSSVVLTAIVAVLLNLFFNGIGAGAGKDAPAEPVHAA